MCDCLSVKKERTGREFNGITQGITYLRQSMVHKHSTFGAYIEKCVKSLRSFPVHIPQTWQTLQISVFQKCARINAAVSIDFCKLVRRTKVEKTVNKPNIKSNQIGS